MKYISLFFIVLFLTNCHFEETFDEENDGISRYERIQRDRQARMDKIQTRRNQREQSENENENESENEPEEVSEEVSEEEGVEISSEELEEPSNTLVSVEEQKDSEISPQNIESVSVVALQELDVREEPLSPSLRVLTEESDVTEVSSDETPQVSESSESLQSSQEEPEDTEDPIENYVFKDTQDRGVYISNQTPLSLFYVDKTTNARIPIAPYECFKKPYPEQTGVSRLYFSLLINRNGSDEFVCDNCMVYETTESSYFFVEVSSIYSTIFIFNSATPIVIEPGTVIFNQSQGAVLRSCGLVEGDS